MSTPEPQGAGTPANFNTGPSSAPVPRPSGKGHAAQAIPSPTGTRDFYPIELARRRFIEEAWRKVSVRHGFEEIDGPTFEHLDLYTVKSGDGIVSELFSFQRAGGEKTYALRPEFTPTLARLYAARAAQLPKPAKWFWQGPCFRAERPQRGRLREFLQWNVDIIGGEDRALADAEVIACAVDLFTTLGLKPGEVMVRLNDRSLVARALAESGLAGDPTPGLVLLDKRGKLKPAEFQAGCAQLGIDIARFDATMTVAIAQANSAMSGESSGAGSGEGESSLGTLGRQLRQSGVGQWCVADGGIVRGLAYYTGMVFEVIADGERAIAGGGRYDGLIELFGGPATQAVGFGMGDVVLSLLLQDKKLMPGDREIARSLGLRPDVFVVSNGTPEADAALLPLLVALRGAGMHARRSYKATKNIGKLLKEASDAGSRRALIIENGGGEVTVKDLDENRQWEVRVPVADVPAALARGSAV